MPYVVGIDIGDTTTVAAVSRPGRDVWSAPKVVPLASRSATVPSELRLAVDGSLSAGDPDPSGAVPETGLTVRGFRRRIGDDVPQFIGGEAWTPESLTAAMARWVVERVVAAERGGMPEQIVLGHPAGWGRYRTKLLHRALWAAGLTGVVLLPEPVVAAESHACRGFTGRTLGVCALGGQNHAGSVVRRTPDGRFELLGGADATEPLGGADLDAALLRHIRDQLTTAAPPRPGAAGPARTAPAGLAAACVHAKERLTVATEADVRVHLPDGPARIPVTRAEFERLIRPVLRPVVERLAGAVRSCGLRPDQLDGMLLIGGSARIPLVAELVGERFPVPLTVEAEPAATAASGAAWAAARIVDPGRCGPRDAPAHRPLAVPDAASRRAVGSGGVPDAASRRAVGSGGAPDDLPRRPPDPPLRPDPPPRPPVTLSPLDLPRMRRSGGNAVFGRVTHSGTRS